MDEYKVPFNSNLAAALANANEKILPLIAFANEMNKSMEPVISTQKIHQAIFQSNQGIFDQIRLSVKDIYSPLFRSQNSLLRASIESSKIALLASRSDSFKYVNAVTDIWKANFNFNLNTLSKSDFRIGVISQEISNQLDIYSTEERTYNFHESNYQLDPELTIQPEKTNSHTDDINNLKFTVIELSEKISNLEENSTDKNFNDNQTDEKIENPAYKALKCLVVAFFFVCEFVEHSETAYQLLLWFQQVIQPLLNHFN